MFKRDRGGLAHRLNFHFGPLPGWPFFLFKPGLDWIILSLSKIQPYCAFKCCTKIISGITACKWCRLCWVMLEVKRAQSISWKGHEFITAKGE